MHTKANSIIVNIMKYICLSLAIILLGTILLTKTSNDSVAYAVDNNEEIETLAEEQINTETLATDYSNLPIRYIGTAQELQNMAVERYKNVLTNDIVLPNGFSSIGVYYGAFDGAGYTISNVTNAIFDDVTGLVENIVVADSTSTSTAFIANSIHTGTTIKNCTIQDTCSINTTSSIAGGIVGRILGGSIINCTNHAAVRARNYAGGIAGLADGVSSSIENCINSGIISVASGKCCGGILGYKEGILNGYITTIKSCMSSTTIVGGCSSNTHTKSEKEYLLYPEENALEEVVNPGGEFLGYRIFYTKKVASWVPENENYMVTDSDMSDYAYMSKNIFGLKFIAEGVGRYYTSRNGGSYQVLKYYTKKEVRYFKYVNRIIFSSAVEISSSTYNSRTGIASILSQYIDVKNCRALNPISATYMFSDIVCQGSGTQEDPYRITNIDELYTMLLWYYNGGTAKHYKLMNDIDLRVNNRVGFRSNENNWLEVTFPRDSSFDGNGFSLSGLYMYSLGFAYENNGTIKNFTISESTILSSAYDDVGAFATINNGIIDNCCFGVNTYLAKGGLLVGINCGTIKNCYTASDEYNCAYQVGGIAEKNVGGTITNCINNAKLSGSSAKAGIVCENKGGTLSHCINYGYISSTNSYAGGIVAQSYMLDDEISTIEYCYNRLNNDALTWGATAGGIVAEDNYSAISYCINEQNITGSNRAGGIVGYSQGSNISYSINGKVQPTGNQYATITGRTIGGIIGYSANNTVVDYCYNSGRLVSINTVGGLIGTIYNGGTISNSYSIGQILFDENRISSYGESAGLLIGNIVEKTQDVTITKCFASKEFFLIPEKEISLIGSGVSTIVDSSILDSEAMYYENDNKLFGSDQKWSYYDSPIEEDHYFPQLAWLTNAFEEDEYYQSTGNECSYREYFKYYEVLWNVNFIDSNGQIIDSKVVRNNEFVSPYEYVTIAYDVQGWALNRNGSIYDFNKPINRDRNFYLIYTPYFDDELKNNPDGTEEKPFVLSTAKHLQAMSDLFNGDNAYKYIEKRYILKNDISFGRNDNYNDENNTNFVSMGLTTGSTFGGVFDGCGYSIKNIMVSSTSLDIGLFYYNNGSIKNLTIYGEFSSTADNVGGFAGTNNGTIEACRNVCKVTGNFNVGGIAGYNQGSIIDCANDGSIIAKENIGGIVGISNNGTISHTYNTGYIISSKGSGVGGIVGSCNNTSINSVYNAGEIVGYSDMISDSAAGLLVGYLNNSTVTNGYALDNEYINLLGYIINSSSSSSYEMPIYKLSYYDNMVFGNDSRWGYMPGDYDNGYAYYPYLTVLDYDEQYESLIADIYSPHIFSKGRGTIDNPFVITTAQQLQTVMFLADNGARYNEIIKDSLIQTLYNEVIDYIANEDNGAKLLLHMDFSNACYKIGCDITFKENYIDDLHTYNFYPINSEYIANNVGQGPSFSGVIDGGGNTIKGLIIKALPSYGNAYQVGLVGNLFGTGELDNIGTSTDIDGRKGVIKNLTIKNSKYVFDDANKSSQIYVGAFAGDSNNGIIYNCNSVNNDLAFRNSCQELRIGGIVGRATAMEIRDCTNRSSVYASLLGIQNGAGDLGGIAGSANATKILNCTNFGYIHGIGHKGGIAAVTGNLSNINNCINYGDVFSVKVAILQITQYAGGIVGQGSAVDCVNFGVITGDSSPTGGIVGEGKANYCTNYGRVSTTGTSYSCGGIAGTGIVYDSINNGEVYGTSILEVFDDCLGGIVGYGRAVGCTNNGNVNGTSNNVGGIVGNYSIKNDLTLQQWQTGLCSTKDIIRIAETEIDVLYCDCNVFSELLENSGDMSNINKHTSAQMYDSTAVAFDNVSQSFVELLSNYNISEENIISLTELSDTYSLYSNFHSKLKQLYLSSNDSVAKQFNESFTEGMLVGINRPYIVECGLPTIPSINEIRSIIARLFGYSDVNTFVEYAQALASEYEDNALGASNETLASRLKYNGAVYTENGCFVLPFVFKNASSNSVDVCIIVDTTGAISVLIDDVAHAYKVAQVYDDNFNAHEITNVEHIESYARCELFERSGSREICSNVNVGSVEGNNNVGGIIGKYEINLAIENPIYDNYNTGSVSGNFHVGGIVGYSVSGVDRCFNTGTVDGKKYIGGVGGTIAKVTNSYNTGSISAEYNIAGGVAGEGYYVENCYNTGSVLGQSYVGGIMGMGYDASNDPVAYNGATIKNSYYSTQSMQPYFNYLTSDNSVNIDELSCGKTNKALTYAGNQYLGDEYIYTINEGLVFYYPTLGINNDIEKSMSVSLRLVNVNILNEDGSYYGTYVIPETTTIAFNDIVKDRFGYGFERLYNEDGDWDLDDEIYEDVVLTISYYEYFENSDSYSEDGYFLITKPEHLINLSALIYNDNDNYATLTYVLGNNIDMSGIDFIPIGNEYATELPFRGVFDGQGYTINNLTISGQNGHKDIKICGYEKSTPDYSHIGLFGYVCQDENMIAENKETGVVKNLGLIGGNISALASNVTGTHAKDNVGSIIGLSNGASLNNCFSTAKVYGKVNAGGLIGKITGDLVSNQLYNLAFNGVVTCVELGETVGFGSNFGALIGEVQSDNIAEDFIMNAYVVGPVYMRSDNTNRVISIIGNSNSSNFTSLRDNDTLYYISDATSGTAINRSGLGISKTMKQILIDELYEICDDMSLLSVEHDVDTYFYPQIEIFVERNNAEAMNALSRNIYVVSFYSNGADRTFDTLYLFEENYKLNAEDYLVSIDNYTFSGWYAFGSEKWDFDSTVNTSMNLVAKWKVDSTEVSISASTDSIVYNTGEIVLYTNAQNSFAQSNGIEYEYMWLKDGIEIPNATGRSLRLTEVSQSGEYTCMVIVSDGICYNIDKSNVVTVNIRKAVFPQEVEAPTIEPVTYSKDMKLSDIELPDNYYWLDPDQELSATEGTRYEMYYEPENKNYGNVESLYAIVKVTKLDTVINVDMVRTEYTYTGSEIVVDSGATSNSPILIMYNNNKIMEPGEYEVTIYTLDSVNYNPAEVKVTVHVDKAEGIIAANEVQYCIFNGQKHNVKVHMNNTEQELQYTEKSGYTNIGAYDISVKALASSHYTESNTVNIRLIILKDRISTVEGNNPQITIISNQGINDEASVVANIVDNQNMIDRAKLIVARDCDEKLLFGTLINIEVNNATRLAEPTVRLALPEELKGKATYQVVYIADDGTSEELATTIDGDYIVFDTLHFSNYAILYKEAPQKVEVWKIILPISIILVGLATIVVVYIISKVQFKKNKKQR